MTTHSLKRGFLWLLIVSFSLTALLAIVALLGGGNISETEGRIIVTTLILAAASATSMAGSEAGRRVPALSAFCLAMSGLSFLLAEYNVWTDESDQTFMRTLLVLTTLAIGSSYLCLLFIRSRPGERGGVVLAHWLAVSGTVITSLLVCSFIVREDFSEGGARLLGAIIILTLLGTALALIFRKLAGREESTGLVGRKVLAVDGDALVLEGGRRLRLAAGELAGDNAPKRDCRRL